MLFGRVRVAKDHLNARVAEHRGQRNQINPSHRRSRRPGMTKIIRPEAWNRILVCFQSDAVNSRERADVCTIHFDDWLVSRSTGKDKIAVHFLKASSQERTSPLGERDFASGCLCLSERVEEIALVEMNAFSRRMRQTSSGRIPVSSIIVARSFNGCDPARR